MRAVQNRCQNTIINQARRPIDCRPRHDAPQPAQMRQLGPKGDKRGNPRQKLPLMDHMQPPRRKICADPPMCGLIECIKPQRQPLTDRPPAIRVDLKTADRAGIVVKNAGYCHVAKIGGVRGVARGSCWTLRVEECSAQSSSINVRQGYRQKVRRTFGQCMARYQAVRM